MSSYHIECPFCRTKLEEKHFDTLVLMAEQEHDESIYRTVAPTDKMLRDGAIKLWLKKHKCTEVTK